MQFECTQRVLAHVETMCRSKQWRAIALVERVAYDETPLDVRVEYGDDAVVREVGKLFMVERAYSLLIQRLPSSLLPPSGSLSLTETAFVLNICQSPRLRAAANATGETTHEVLASIPDAVREFGGIFDIALRLAEIDESGSIKCPSRAV
eukprot:6456706-Amphidinium_carterae.1